MALTIEQLKARFWAKVRKGEGCWEWTAATYPGGHGAFWGGGSRSEGRLVRAHRFSYEVHIGPIPEGAHVLHRCDNPRCVRPDHLELGDHAKNMRDAGLRRLMRRGARHGMARLTEDDVRAIRKLRASGMTQAEAGARFGVARSTVQNIDRGANWGWLK